MKTFILVLDGIIFVAIFFAVIEVYLKINKVWKRKHEKQVADSQSLYGLGLSFFISIVWTTKYIMIGEYTSIADNSIYLIETIAMIIVGMGWFLDENRNNRKNPWKLIQSALKQEKKEASYLLKNLTGKKQALDIINILNMLANIDNNFDKKEEALIKKFAKAFKLEYPFKNNELIPLKDSPKDRLTQLKQTIQSFLDNSPNKKQAIDLQILMEQLINIDGNLDLEEEKIFEEVQGMITQYINPDANVAAYHILIVPQDNAQRELIKNLRPDAKEIHVDGGMAYSLEKHFSYKYADSMCQTYRDQNLFTIVKEINS